MTEGRTHSAWDQPKTSGLAVGPMDIGAGLGLPDFRLQQYFWDRVCFEEAKRFDGLRAWLADMVSVHGSPFDAIYIRRDDPSYPQNRWGTPRDEAIAKAQEWARENRLDSHWVRGQVIMSLCRDLPITARPVDDLAHYAVHTSMPESWFPLFAPGPQESFNPAFESSTAYRDKVRASLDLELARYIDQMERLARDEHSMGNRQNPTEFKRDVGWVIRHHVHNEGFATIARGKVGARLGATEGQVRVAVHGMEQRLGLDRISKPGRKPGRRDTIKRVRGTPAKPKKK